MIEVIKMIKVRLETLCGIFCTRYHKGALRNVSAIAEFRSCSILDGVSSI